MAMLMGTIAATRTRVVRRFAFVIPWSLVETTELPAFADGWGDFADPERLTVDCGPRGPMLEVGWGGATGKRCDELALQFNAAVESLKTSEDARRR